MRNFHEAHVNNRGTGVRMGWQKVVAVALIFSLLSVGALPTVWAQGATQSPSGDQGQNSNAEVGLEAASWALTVPYGAAKVVFAILGGIFGGMTYVFSGGNTEAAKAVWDTSVRGTYVITPAHLRGDKPVRFLGVPPEQDTAQGVPSTEPAR